MASKANPRLIGAFVVVGIGLMVAAAVIFGSFNLFGKRIPFVVYFQGDLNGLDVGAPVNFRGVPIGQVTGLELHFNADTKQFTIPVYGEIDPENFVIEGSAAVRTEGENIPLLVKQGLRAQLSSQSFVTGKLLIELDFHPDTPATMLADADEHVQEIPTIPSTLEQLQSSVEAIVKSIAAANLPEMMTDVRQLIASLDQQVQALHTTEISEDTRKLLQQLTALTENTNARIDEMSESFDRAATSIQQTADQGTVAVDSANRMFNDISAAVESARPMVEALDTAAKRASALLATANGTIEPGSPVYRELMGLMNEITLMSQSIRNLADQLERDPTSILFGRQEN